MPVTLNSTLPQLQRTERDVLESFDIMGLGEGGRVCELESDGCGQA